MTELIEYMRMAVMNTSVKEKEYYDNCRHPKESESNQ